MTTEEIKHRLSSALDYNDLKDRYNYFPPSMFVHFEKEAEDKIYNTIHRKIDAKGFFVLANQIRQSSSSAY